MPSRAPGPQVSGSLKPSRKRVGRVDDELVEARDPGAAGDRGHDGVQCADLRRGATTRPLKRVSITLSAT